MLDVHARIGSTLVSERPHRIWVCQRVRSSRISFTGFPLVVSSAGFVHRLNHQMRMAARTTRA
ncbi:hypothetical protein C3Y87_21415, partial [Carbonactinospora thermoautotrophica]|nr:hypothetical protein [Carbonactinospora thermoautotrophica]